MCEQILCIRLTLAKQNSNFHYSGFFGGCDKKFTGLLKKRTYRSIFKDSDESQQWHGKNVSVSFPNASNSDLSLFLITSVPKNDVVPIVLL